MPTFNTFSRPNRSTQKSGRKTFAENNKIHSIHSQRRSFITRKCRKYVFPIAAIKGIEIKNFRARFSAKFTIVRFYGQNKENLRPNKLSLILLRNNFHKVRVVSRTKAAKMFSLGWRNSAFQPVSDCITSKILLITSFLTNFYRQIGYSRLKKWKHQKQMP